MHAVSNRMFSILWKIFSRFFHAMEKYFPHCGKKRPIFPHNGKTFRDFSTQWKIFFHSVENLVLGLFSGVFGLFSGAVERSARRPLSTVERGRPRGREKRRPTKSGSALSRSRLGCGVVARPFFLAPRSGIVALSGAKGALRVERCPTQGAVKNS